jgi:hypothetical protein
MSSAFNAFLHGAPRATSIIPLTRGNGVRNLQLSYLRPGSISKPSAYLDATRTSFTATSLANSSPRRPLRYGEHSYRAFSHSASCGRRNPYRRFDQTERGEEPERAQYGSFQFLSQRLLRNRVLLTVIGLGGGFYLYNLETVEVSSNLPFPSLRPERRC